MPRKSTDYIQLYLEHGIDIPGRRIDMTSLADGSGEESGVDWQLTDRVLRGLNILGDIGGAGSPAITLIINNHGGEDDHARAIIAAIRNCPSEVHGIVYGRAESAAAWILQACDHRSMASNSNLMLHMGSSAKDSHSTHVDNLFIDDVLVRIHEKDPGYKRSKLERDLHKDWYVYAEDALELGLIDEVLK